MKHAEQVELLEELLGLKESKQLFLDDRPSTNPSSDYADPERYALEHRRVISRLPTIVAHSSELDDEHSFIRRLSLGLPLLLTRADDGSVRAFLNVCRHRGTRLVDDHRGCKQRFTCPYHAWTWNNRGEFVGAPHFDKGFDEPDRSSLELKTIPCVERHGFIWLLPEPGPSDLARFLESMDEDLEWAVSDDLIVHDTEMQLRDCNWKLLLEGGLEAYHFRVAHRKTIARLFNDNLSSYVCHGPHIRSILPRATLSELREQAQSEWNIREQANVLYTLFPNSSLLVQSDHVIWVKSEPLSVNQTEVRVVTLKPRNSEASKSYWDKNHGLTVMTLNEDFDLAESIQSGMASGANDYLRFGRFEGALRRFNDFVSDYLRE